MITQERAIPAGQQFAGTEFSVAPSRPGIVLRLEEVDLQMGPEVKTWSVRKVTRGGLTLVLAQSTDTLGAPAPNAVSNVLMAGLDVSVVLEAGDQIQVITAGATSAMRAKVYLSERRTRDLTL